MGGDAVDVGAQARPAREAVLAGDDELGGGQLERLRRRRRRALGGDARAGLGVAGAVGALQVAGAVAQLLQARSGGQRVGSSRQPPLRGARGPRAPGGKKVQACDVTPSGWARPFPRTGRGPGRAGPSLDDRLARPAALRARPRGGAARARPRRSGAPARSHAQRSPRRARARGASRASLGARRRAQRLVLGDRRAEVERSSARRLASSWPSRMRSSRAVARRARRAPAKRSHARANETKLVRPPQRWAASIGHTPPARSEYAPTMISLPRMPVEHRRAACGPGRQSIARRRSSIGERARDIGLRASKATPPRAAMESGATARKGGLHEARRAHRLLGPRPDEPGPARDRPGGRAPRLRQRLDGRGVRLGRGDDPRLARRADVDDQDRLGDLPDARPLARR